MDQRTRDTMLERAELEALFLDQESDRVERKASLADGEKIREAICALANDFAHHRRPGVIFVGQNSDRSCAGLHIDERLLETLGGWRSDGNILPFPAMSVGREELHGCQVAVVIVHPTDNPPVRYKGRVWIRVGPRRGVASAQEERMLLERRRWANLPFDQQPVAGASTTDLDLARFHLEFLPALIPSDIIAQNDRSIEQQLLTLRMTNSGGIPTTSGLLLLGKDPQSWFPGAYIQWRRIAGSEITDETIDDRAIAGTIIDQARRIDEFMDAANKVALSVHEGRHERTADYPQIALQQFVRNALMHRTYEGSNTPVRVTWLHDRVEILSPGGPYGAVTIENFGIPGVTDYRNPVIAEAFRGYGLVERFGLGISLARKILRENGHPPPEFQIINTFVNVTVRAKQ